MSSEPKPEVVTSAAYHADTDDEYDFKTSSRSAMMDYDADTDEEDFVASPDTDQQKQSGSQDRDTSGSDSNEASSNDNDSDRGNGNPPTDSNENGDNNNSTMMVQNDVNCSNVGVAVTNQNQLISSETETNVPESVSGGDPKESGSGVGTSEGARGNDGTNSSTGGPRIATTSEDDNVVVIVNVFNGAETQESILTLKRTNSVTELANAFAFGRCTEDKFYFLTLNNPKEGGWCEINPGTTVEEITKMTADGGNKITATKRVVNWITATNDAGDADASDNDVTSIGWLQGRLNYLYQQAASFARTNCFLADGNKDALLLLYESTYQHARKSCQVVLPHKLSPSTLAIYFSELAGAISDYRRCPFNPPTAHQSFAKGWNTLLDTYMDSLNAVDTSPPIKRMKTTTKKAAKAPAKKAVPSAYIPQYGEYKCGGCGLNVTAVTSFRVTLYGYEATNCIRGLVRVQPTNTDGNFQGNFKGNCPPNWCLHIGEYMFTDLSKFISKTAVNALDQSLPKSKKYVLRLLLSPLHSFLQLYLHRYDCTKIEESLPSLIEDFFPSDNESGRVVRHNEMLVMCNIFMVLGKLLENHWPNYASHAWSGTTGKNYLRDGTFDTSELIDNTLEYTDEKRFYKELLKTLVDSKQIKDLFKNIFLTMSEAMQDGRAHMNVDASDPEKIDEDKMIEYIAGQLMKLLYMQVKNMWTEDGKRVLVDIAIVESADKFAKEISTTIATMMFKHMKEWMLMIEEATK
eukprot:CAMPEP_0201720208 /NCGR_PEP_ID=MMETSP0593-20130828/5223_1 /ASSEMBLY_ACC=CAM_ASM_000672 /TAXON_ID=267983 /ORGANISM="Skeletonema japonicum, Strain CCMP2506" /LENGTH=744 /DNA_ID=CAMNT_0048210817 /DNA_START=45 /DNA_END=2279 /DNA_ORIENTATION=+